MPGSAPTAPAVETPEQQGEVRIQEMLPAWLTSLVWHLLLVLVLALITARAGGAGGNSGVLLDVDLGDAGTPDVQGLLDDAMLNGSDLTSTLTAGPEQIRSPATPLETALNDAIPVPLLEVPNPIEALAAGAAKQGDGGNDGGNGRESNGNGGGKGDGSGGQGLFPARTQVFGLKSEGSRFVYVFDRSESMNSIVTFATEDNARRSITPLDAAKAELLRSLNDLSPGQQFQIVFYNHSPLVFSKNSARPRLLPATRENIYRATAFVRQMPGEGNTHHMEPLEMALAMRPDVIYLMTDGEAKDDLWDQQFKRLALANKGHARIHVIQFGFEETSQSILKRLAEENGGEYLYLNIARLAAFRGIDSPAPETPAAETPAPKPSSATLDLGTLDPQQDSAPAPNLP